MSDQSEILKFEQATGLKLSQAIRIGASLRPQCASFLFRHGHSCALGAAWEGSGGKYLEFKGADYEPYNAIYDDLESRFGKPIVEEVMTMNDIGMSREHIADRLQALGY